MSIEDIIRMQKVQESTKPVCGRNEEHVALLGGCHCPFNCDFCFWYIDSIKEKLEHDS